MPEPEQSTLPGPAADANILDPIIVSQDDPLSSISDEDPPSLIDAEDPEDTDGEAPVEVTPDIPVEVEALPEEDPAAGEIADAEPATYDDPDDLQGGDALDATGAEDDDPDPMDAGDAGPDGVITQIVEGVPHEDAFGLDLLLINDVDPDETEPEEPEDEGPEEEDDLTCFVATAAFRDHAHPDVVFLRRFRDEKLTASAAGRLFISAYWTMGPILAVPVRRSDRLAAVSRKVIGLIVGVLRRLS